MKLVKLSARQSTLVAAVLLVLAAAQFFVYEFYVGPRREAVRDLQALTELLQVDNRERPGTGASGNRGTTLPELLSQVQQLASQASLTLKGIEPTPGEDKQFKMSLEGRFGNLLEFLARFESLRVAVTAFDVAPAMENPALLLVSLSFSHDTAAAPLRPERIGEFLSRLRGARDAFNPSAGPIMAAADPNSDDLTWAYHLTSISEIGTNKYATIDGEDYNVGDEIQGLVVTDIGEDRVTLLDKEMGGDRKRVLRFRTLPASPT